MLFQYCYLCCIRTAVLKKKSSQPFFRLTAPVYFQCCCILSFFADIKHRIINKPPGLCFFGRPGGFSLCKSCDFSQDHDDIIRCEITVAVGIGGHDVLFCNHITPHGRNADHIIMQIEHQDILRIQRCDFAVAVKICTGKRFCFIVEHQVKCVV